MRRQVSLVVPLREVTLVEPAENQSSTGADKSILVTTSRSSFLFAQIHDRDFVVQKISELLAKSKLNYMYACLLVIFFSRYKTLTTIRVSRSHYIDVDQEIMCFRRIPRTVTSATVRKRSLWSSGSLNHR